VIATKRFDAGDAMLRAAIREQVGSIVKRLHRSGAIEEERQRLHDRGYSSALQVASGSAEYASCRGVAASGGE
jgi:hypothetical protein